MSKPPAFLSRLAAGEILLADGAWGTELQKLGLGTGECPEAWNVEQPERIRELAEAYCAAGADLLKTNTFNGTRYRLRALEHEGKVEPYNRAGAEIAREVADRHGVFVAGCVGPTGEYAEPRGLLTRKQLYDAFAEQMRALKAGGVDVALIETLSDLDEAAVAAEAARDLDLPAFVTVTFHPEPGGYRTLTGIPAPEAARALDALPAAGVGSNCGTGLADMVHILRQMRPHTAKPLVVQANAGLPRLEGGRFVYDDSPAQMAALLPELVAAGAQLIGGCCGTTPEHIRAFRAIVDALNAGRAKGRG
ncbi:MAG: homocysteine S-methyltransferase family protein [Planctomycetota bacterium]|nr:homocysteine S-methyltransferase family protein [Planctomycetota bacterium]